MFAKTSLILTLIVSLLFATQAAQTLPVEMKPGGTCGAVAQCVHNCCSSKVCCKTTEQQRAPQPSPSAPDNTHVQLADLGLQTWTLLFIPPTARRPFVILDEMSAAHTLPPLVASCIRLI